ncbi:MAG: S8 family serine peptidase [Bacteroidetes bacterium]|nr:S8 family serine peptidase [Bacteroidota bacterium]MBP6650538.1 S8 family serine peptidase [Bacteroidia bacterium]
MFLRILLVLILVSSCFVDAGASKYFISFSDKNNTPYSVSTPSDFLSAKAISRRITQNIPVLQNDLPVDPAYILAVQNTGAVVLNRSKWYNGIIIDCDSATLQAVTALPFVNSSTAVNRIGRSSGKIDKFKTNSVPYNSSGSLARTQSFDYGGSFNQIHLMNGEYLHDAGFKGEGMTIAILDAGFYSVDQLSPFDSIRAGGQILGTWDFVANDASVYEDNSHGMSVLSCIAGNVPGQLIGTAPHSDFWLLRSEDAPTENIIEEYNWVSAAEFADSAGADLISSSLGYSTFDDSTMSHTYADMNGNTCPASIGADIAASKGILVLVSAGNLGNSAWHYISAPSDADSVLSVGSVDSAGYKSGFSSWGPSSDGNVKPNVAAKGSQTTIANTDGSIGQGSGTSFSCPVLAGSAACLWQAHPGKTNMEVLHAIEQSANYFNTPGDSLGYGIPNFIVADLLLGGTILDLSSEDNLLSVFPNPFSQDFEISFYSSTNQTIHLSLIDEIGQEVGASDVEINGGKISNISFPSLSGVHAGIYFVRVISKSKSYLRKIVKI